MLESDNVRPTTSVPIAERPIPQHDGTSGGRTARSERSSDLNSKIGRHRSFADDLISNGVL